MTEMPFRQRQFMRQLVTKLGPDQKKVCAAYAKAEREGLVTRSRDEYDTSPEVHAETLWRDAQRWGWLNG
jgi:DNA-binding MarR family transcriptional regulator